jgi:hypothetical protein
MDRPRESGRPFRFSSCPLLNLSVELVRPGSCIACERTPLTKRMPQVYSLAFFYDINCSRNEVISA